MKDSAAERLNDNVLVSINVDVVTVHPGRFVLEWVTVCGRMNHLGI